MKRTPIKRRTPMKRVSKRREKEGAEYAKLRKQFLAQHPYCQLWLAEHEWTEEEAVEMNGEYEDHRFDMQTGGFLTKWRKIPLSTDIHHKAKRGKNYLNTDTWMAVCRTAHQRIHANPSWAREKGYLT